MRYLVGVISLLLFILTVRAAGEDKPNTLTPEQQAEGWTLLFDGTSTDAWNVKGGVEIVDGTLVFGGPEATRVSVKRPLGRNFELRTQFRVEGTGQPSLRFERRHFLGSGTVLGQSLAKTSGGSPTDWQELILTGRYDSARDNQSVNTVTRRNTKDGGSSSSSGSSGFGGQGTLTLHIQIPSGTKLLLRNVLLYPDPDVPDKPGSPTLPLVVLAGFLALLLAALFIVRRLGRRRQGDLSLEQT